MSATDRQNRLLVAQDWKRIYQTFRNADFQSYDFDNLRRTMINYLRENYPEDFNDYIESSEYLALIDLIAFLGQNLSFRIDLNARENFLELAERRESVLRLARLLSYNVKRNLAANGLLKFDSVVTTERILDSNNFNLAGQSISWNDPTNPNWFEQFVKILNASLPVNGTFGRPNKKDVVAGIPSEQYRFNAINTDIPVYRYSKSVEGLTTPFEVVSTDLEDGAIVEEAPARNSSLAFLYRDNGQGAASTGSGFFCHFRQGTLDEGNFVVDNPVPNQVIGIDTRDINNSDVWLYKLDADGNEEEFWTKVEAVEGNNVIYNSLSKQIRNFYSVLTRADDRINLIFSDGVFGNLPRGAFKAYYRTSANRAVVINPGEMQSITITVPYISRAGGVEELTISMSLKTTVDNGSPAETTDSIKSNAPATYYTQNRMVTAEDYNIAPLGVSQEIVKVKSVNRTSSGISRYFDLIDASGKYTSVNLYGNDGVIYKEKLREKGSFTFQTQTDIEGVILNTIEPIVKDRKVLNFYYDNFTKLITSDLLAEWVQSTSDTNSSTGYFKDVDGLSYTAGTFTTNSLRYLEPGTLCKFEAPAGLYIMPNGTLTANGAQLGASSYKWSKVISIAGSGIEVSDGIGPIQLNDIIPATMILAEVRPKLATSIVASVRTQIIDQVFTYNSFGLRYDVNERKWKLVTKNNLDITSEFSTSKTGNVTNQNLDASWLILFSTNGEAYTITYRGQRYVFESDAEIKFYYDSSDKVYDTRVGEVVKDKIQVMSINTKPDETVPFTVNYDWQVVEEYRDKEGYVDTKKVQVSFFDSDDDGVVDNPTMFSDIVEESANVTLKYIFQKRIITNDGVEDFRYVDAVAENIIVVETEISIGSYSSYEEGTTFYIISSSVFKTLTNSILVLTSVYRGFLGRDNLKFSYVHAADSNSRLDPSASNIMDTFMLTRRYDIEYRKWLSGARSSAPLPPSSDELFRSFGQELNKIKTISDEVIYHPVKYKVLFGSKASESLRAIFKVVKNPDLVINDNDVRTRVIGAINQYFALDNWEFGETFFFSELATYVMNQLTPDVVSFVIVPVQESQVFGSLFEIKSENDEVFISGATVNEVELIDSITATRLQAGGQVITTSTSINSGIQSNNGGIVG